MSGWHLCDEPREIVWLVAESAGEGEEFAGLGNEFGLLGGGGGDRHATALSELEQALIAECAQRAENGVRIDAEDGSEISGRWQSVTGSGFALGDSPSQGGGDLLVQGCRVGRIDRYRRTAHPQPVASPTLVCVMSV